MTIKRKQNTPKKYPNPKGKVNPREVCPECQKKGIDIYLKKTQCRYTRNGKLTTVTPLSFCIKCDYVKRDEEEIKKIPE